MQVFMILLNIACNMQNMQNNVHDMQNMQTSFPICRICTAQFADANLRYHKRTEAPHSRRLLPGGDRYPNAPKALRKKELSILEPRRLNTRGPQCRITTLRVRPTCPVGTRDPGPPAWDASAWAWAQRHELLRVWPNRVANQSLTAY